jgi:peptide-methionine (S)-S-oxide reductase
MSFPTLAACLAGVLAMLAGFAAAAPADEPARENTPDAPKTAETAAPQTEKATFGGGCFWCMEAVFERIPGVKAAVSGYAGGTVPHPTYQMVCTGQTGHAEVVQVEFDPKVVSYETLLDVFWHFHDPTTLNQQGPDIGTQYRSIILYQSDSQRQAAQKSMNQLRSQGVPIVTELVPLMAFYPAEAYHQNYYDRHRSASYCRMMIAPKLRKLSQSNITASPAGKGEKSK